MSSRTGSVANDRKQESLDSQALDFPTYDCRILPRKGHFATEPNTEPDGVRFPSTLAALVQVYTGLGELDAPYASVIISVPHLGHDVFG
jgi:hypothetical protein